MNEWKTYKLGEISDVIDCPHSTPKWTDNGILVIRSWNVRNGRLIFDKLSFTNKTTYVERTRRAKPNGGDLILTREAPMGEVCRIPDGLECCLGQRLVLLKVKKGFDNNFLLYALQSPLVQSKIMANEGTGSTVSNLRIPDIKALEISSPPDIETQHSIASILSSLDDKIELNLQMNQTLETMAQTIFKEWFVNFNFPGFDGKFVNGLPKRWKKCKLSEVINIKHGFAFKGEYFTEAENQFILVTPGNFNIGGGFNYSKFKYFNGEIPKDYILDKNDLIVTMTDLSKEGDTLGYSALVPEILGKTLLHNQRIGKIEFKSNQHLKYYLYLLMRQPLYRNFILGGATGSTVKHTSPSRICEYEIVLPEDIVLFEFEKIIKDLNSKILMNYIQNRTLSQLLESLLPRLISGKIRVKSV